MSIVLLKKLDSINGRAVQRPAQMVHVPHPTGTQTESSGREKLIAVYNIVENKMCIISRK